ncbi:MAG: BamA/TamA family outer membrane protein [Bacteroidales bacterium]|nr:BamA/TamA family outer membrane protein [Bacteroidales bacterium]
MKIRLTIIFILLSIIGYSQEDSLSTISKEEIPQKNIVDRVMSLFETNFGRTSIKYYPSAGIDPASGISIGALSLISIVPKETDRKKIRFFRPTSISNMVTYSTKKWLNMKSDVILYASHGFVVNTFVQYQVSPDHFYGIGNDTLNTNPVKFDMKDLRIDGNISKELSQTWFLGFNFDISHRNYTALDSGESILPEQKNKWLIGFGPYLTYDSRDHINYPSHGEYVTIGIKYFAPHSSNAYSFYSLEINARKYITLYKDIILAMSLFNGLSEGDIPFYCLYQLGGQTRLRGISNKYMYIDKNAYYAQCELRKHIWNRFGLVVFGGLGNTYPKISEINSNHIKYVYGAGIRFQSDTRSNINLRMDYGRGSFGDSGIYMTMREAF